MRVRIFAIADTNRIIYPYIHVSILCVTSRKLPQSSRISVCLSVCLLTLLKKLWTDFNFMTLGGWLRQNITECSSSEGLPLTPPQKIPRTFIRNFLSSLILFNVWKTPHLLCYCKNRKFDPVFKPGSGPAIPKSIIDSSVEDCVEPISWKSVQNISKFKNLILEKTGTSDHAPFNWGRIANTERWLLDSPKVR